MISIAHVKRFLEREQQDTSQWLRDGMDQLVDQMFNQLRHKFMDSLKEDGSFRFAKNMDHLLSSITGATSTSVEHHHQELDTQMEQLNNHPNQEPISERIAEPISGPILQPIVQSIAGPIPEPITEPIAGPIPEPIAELIAEPIAGPILQPILQPIAEPTAEPIIKQEFHKNDYEENILLHDSDEEDCDCDDCTTLNGAIKLEEEEDLPNQGPNWFQEPISKLASEPIPEPISEPSSNGSSSSSTTTTKRPRLESEEVSKKNQIVPESVQESTDYNILALKCILPDCEQEFKDTPELNRHLLHAHGLYQFRCALMSCNRSFPERSNLQDHLQFHGNLAEFHCAHCSKQLPDYAQLHLHTVQQHHAGRFHCSYPNCDFVGLFREIVSRHYVAHTALVCDFVGCGHKFKNITFAKAHKRAHLGIVPYRCLWPGCTYAHAARSTAMNHIWRIHFKVPDDKRKDFDVVRGLDPRDYLEVIQELL